MEIFSRKLNKNVNLEIIQKDDEMFATHNSFMELYQSLKDELGLTIKPLGFPSQWALFSHVAIPVELTDKFGHSEYAIGEAGMDTLENEISKKYFTHIAYNRGFDNVLCNYLGIEKIQSITDDEVPGFLNEVTPEAPAEQPIIQTPVVQQMSFAEMPVVPAPVTPVMPAANVSPVTAQVNTIPVAPNVNPTPVIPTPTVPQVDETLPGNGNPGKTIVTFGPTSGIAIEATDPSVLKWIISVVNEQSTFYPIKCDVEQYVTLNGIQL